MISALIAFVGLGVAGARAESITWRWITHTVAPRETVREIALSYFGVKQAEGCIAQQIFFANRDLIHPGQNLRFLAPAEKLSLRDYRRLNPSCSFRKVVVDGKSVESTDNGVGIKLVEDSGAPPPEPVITVIDRTAPKKQIVPPPEPTVEPLSQRLTAEPPPDFESDQPPPMPRRRVRGCKPWPFESHSLSAGTGISHTRFRQSWGGASDGTARLATMRPTPLWGRLRLASGHGWWTDFQIEHLGRDIITAETAAAAAIRYDWTVYQAVVAVEPLSFRLLGRDIHTFVRAGYSFSEWPVADPSDDQVTMLKVPIHEAKGGLGFYSYLSDAWLFELGLHWNEPLSKSTFQKLSMNYAVDGYMQLSYTCFENQVYGLNWHGRAQETKFHFRNFNAQGQLLYSSLEFFVGLWF